jgi:hypothetical protein
MTDFTIAISAFVTLSVILLIQNRYLRRQLEEARYHRRRWQKIAHYHAQNSAKWEQIAAQRTRPPGPGHVNCRCTTVPGDQTPVRYMLMHGHVTVPYAIGKSPFSAN